MVRAGFRGGWRRGCVFWKVVTITEQMELSLNIFVARQAVCRHWKRGCSPPSAVVWGQLG